MRILIVDDDDNVRKMLVRGLTLLGHEVISADNGRTALEVLAETGVDLVMTDMFMPEMDGFEFLKELRLRLPDVPAIALSGGGTGMPGDIFLRVARKLGVFCTLQKPFSLTEVSMAIDALLQQQAPPVRKSLPPNLCGSLLL